MVLSAASSSRRSAARPLSSKRAPSESINARCRDSRPSSTAWGHWDSPGAGNQLLSRSRSFLRPRRTSATVSTAGRVQQARTIVSAASRVLRRRVRSSRTSSSARPSRAACRPALAWILATCGPASSGARSSIRWSAWPGSVRRLLSRRQARSTKRSSSAAPTMDRAPSRRKSDTREPSRQASSPSPAAAWGSMKLSSALRRRVQLAASASSRARCRGTPWYTVPPP